MVDRKLQILDVASELLQSRSFTSFSYHDLSERLGISKASVHHHFATKEDLLLALTERYRAGQRRRLGEIDRNHARPVERLSAFFAFMGELAAGGKKICPLGSLQSEFNVIPERVRDDLHALFETAIGWLAGVLKEGREQGELDFEGSPEDGALLILSAVQGGLQIARANGYENFLALTRQVQLAFTPKHTKDA